MLLMATLASLSMIVAAGGARPRARRQPRQRLARHAVDAALAAGGAPRDARQLPVQADRLHARRARSVAGGRLDRGPRARSRAAKWCCSISSSMSRSALLFIFWTEKIARVAERLLPDKPIADDPAQAAQPRSVRAGNAHVSRSRNAAREAMRIGDIVEDMLAGMLAVLKTNDRALAERLRKKDDVVDELYTAVKLYLTQISREALDEKEGRRWADIVSFTINHGAGRRHHRARARTTSRTRRSRSTAVFPTPAWRRSATCTRGWSPISGWA